MTDRKSPKKSETIEIRLAHDAKVAFMARCQQDGRTVSEAVRAFIESEIGRGSRPGRPFKLRAWQALAAALGGLAVGAIAAPSLAHPTMNSRATFERLDRNHDGVLTLDEFRGG